MFSGDLKLYAAISTLQVIFCTKKQDLIIRKCSDKSTYLRPSEVPLGTGQKKLDWVAGSVPALGVDLQAIIREAVFQVKAFSGSFREN